MRRLLYEVKVSDMRRGVLHNSIRFDSRYTQSIDALTCRDEALDRLSARVPPSDAMALQTGQA